MRLPLLRNGICASEAWAACGIMAAAVLVGVLVSASVALASNPWTYLARSSSGMTFFELYVLYSVSDDVRFRLQHEVEVIDFARRALVRQGKIRDLPIVAVRVAKDQQSGRVALIPDCTASEGQGGGQLIGQCYVVAYRNVDAGYEDLFAVTASLADLSGGRSEIEYRDLAPMRTTHAAEIASFNRSVHHFDPIWSPNGTRLLYTVVERGSVRFELLDPSSRAVTRLEPLDEYMTARPIWSDDSRFVAYASPQSVKVFATQTGTTRMFRRQTLSSEMRTAILFEGARLRIFFQAMGTGGDEVDYDAAQGDLRKQESPSGTGRAEWVTRAERHGLALGLHASLKPVRSPIGRHAAIFTFVDGQRRVAVKVVR